MDAFRKSLYTGLLAISMATSISAGAQSGSNLINNPGFESGNDGWVAGSASSIIGFNCHSGSRCLRVGTAAGEHVQDITAKMSSGSTYQFVAQLRRGNPGDDFNAHIRFLDSSGNAIESFAALAQRQLNYQQVSVDFTAPSSFAKAEVVVRKDNSSNNNAYADDLSLVLLEAGTEQPPTEPDPVEEQSEVVTIRANHSGKCIEVADNAQGNQVAIVQRTCNGQPEQNFAIINMGSGGYSIKSTSSGKCLDVVNASTADGARVQQYDCTGSANQVFATKANGDGYMLVDSKSGKCIDVNAVSQDDGAPLQIWSCHSGGNQTFKFVAPGDSEPIPTPDEPSEPSEGEVTVIKPMHSGKCLDIANDSGDNHAAIIQNGCDGSQHQSWKLIEAESNGFRIQSAATGRCLDVVNASKADGARIQQYECSEGAPNQVFVPEQRAQGVRFVDLNSGKCLDIRKLSQADGAELQVWGCGDGAHQHFALAGFDMPVPQPEPQPGEDEDPVPPPALGGITLPFKNSTPTRYLWVSPSGNDSNSGSEGSPLRQVQAAINKAKGKPGTAIMVKAGTYGGLNLSGLKGTYENPIRIISADGQGRAKINGPSGGAAVGAWGVAYVGMYGFHVQSNYGGTSDLGGFKIAGSWNDPARNLVFAGNTITGQGQDGFKLFGGARDCLIVANVINGNWRQEAIDNVSVEDTVYAYNTIVGKSRYTGITMKAGSRNNEIVGNYFDIDSANGIYIGGFGNSRLNRSFPDYWKGFEAAHLNVHHNVVTSKARGRSVLFVGANNNTLSNNYLGGSVATTNHSISGQFNYNSHHNRIVDNNVKSSGFYQPKSGQANGNVVSGNKVSESKPQAGTTSRAAEDFLKMLGL